MVSSMLADWREMFLREISDEHAPQRPWMRVPCMDERDDRWIPVPLFPAVTVLVMLTVFLGVCLAAWNEDAGAERW